MRELLDFIKNAQKRTPSSHKGGKGPVVLIDPGHGGVINGKYTTDPRKMFNHGDFVFYEGVYNRALAWYTMTALYQSNMNYAILTPSDLDQPLQWRVDVANAMYNQLKKDDIKCYLHSIHGNAFGLESVTGIEVFTSPGYTKSDPIATIYYRSLAQLGWKMRPGFDEDLQNDPDKEAKFKILVDTKMPALLTETGFYTNKNEAKSMMSLYTIRRISDLFVKSHDEVTLLNLL